jgi:hypothetical protein
MERRHKMLLSRHLPLLLHIACKIERHFTWLVSN